MDNFINEITEILEVDNVELTDKLTDFECWDSLTVLSIIAFSDEISVTLSAEEIINSSTIGGLQKLINSKMT